MSFFCGRYVGDKMENKSTMYVYIYTNRDNIIFK